MKRKKSIYIILTVILIFVGLCIYSKYNFHEQYNLICSQENNISRSRGTFDNPFISRNSRVNFVITETGPVEVNFWANPLPGKTDLTLRDRIGEEMLYIASSGYSTEKITLSVGEYVLEINSGAGLCNSYVLGVKANDNIQFYPMIDEQRVDVIEAQPEKGFYWDYLLYVPEKLKDGPIYIMVNPNNTGRPSDNLMVHLNKAKATIAAKSQLADLLGIPLLVPVFPRKESNGYVYTHSLDRKTILTDIEELKRVDLQLLAMIEDARDNLDEMGIVTKEKIIIGGFSAAGMFSNRFSIMHPEKVKVAVVGSPGGWPILPIEEYKGEKLRYPIGIGDLDRMIGKSFLYEEYKKVPHFFFIGSEDTNDAVVYRDSYDLEDETLIFRLFGSTPIARWPLAEKMYQQRGMNVRFKTYQGVEHNVSDEAKNDIYEFIKEHIGD